MTTSNPDQRMPRPTASPRVAPVPIAALLMEFQRFQENEAAVRAEYPWADRFVLGLPLMPWQRALVWTEDQSQRFITSAWTGITLGQYILTGIEVFNAPEGPGVQYVRLSNAVLEGQQRLKTLELYFTDALAVPDVAGRPTLWSELTTREQRWFTNRIFDRGILNEFDEDKLRVTYDLLNFGGTRHTEADRAIPAAASTAAKGDSVEWEQVIEMLETREILAVNFASDRPYPQMFDAGRRFTVEICSTTFFINRTNPSGERDPQLTFNEAQIAEAALLNNRLTMADAQGFPFDIDFAPVE